MRLEREGRVKTVRGQAVSSGGEDNPLRQPCSQDGVSPQQGDSSYGNNAADKRQPAPSQMQKSDDDQGCYEGERIGKGGHDRAAVRREFAAPAEAVATRRRIAILTIRRQLP